MCQFHREWVYQSWFFKDLPIGCIAESDLDTDYVMQDSKATPVHVDIPHSMVISLWPTLSLAEVLCVRFLHFVTNVLMQFLKLAIEERETYIQSHLVETE